jgi:hypothetical protein
MFRLTMVCRYRCAGAEQLLAQHEGRIIETVLLL